MNAMMPHLDDRTYDDLLREGFSLLPSVAPEWTNHNPSDPGITLIELLAYFTEMLVYRLGRVTPASKLRFLKLLKGANWEGLTWANKLEFLKLLMGAGWEGWRTLAETQSDLEQQIDCAVANAGPGELDAAIDHVIRNLMRNECAVTARDFEQIAHEAARDHLGAEWPIRTLCVPSVNLENTSTMRNGDYRAHVSIVIVPGRKLTDEAAASLHEKVRSHLLPRCLLTTRVHVVAPVYLCLAIGLKLAPAPGQSMQQLSNTLMDTLQRRFDSETGHETQGGKPTYGSPSWPFGRPLHISELIEAIDATAGVDYVSDVTILQMSSNEQNLALPEFALGLQVGIRSTIGVDTLLGGSRSLGSERLLRNDEGRLVSILLKPWELLRVSLAAENITIIPTRKKSGGDDE
ncbi:hypothetical protein SAMN05216420_101115 [Nitrosospira sp. Nl5]|uniref:hypothetical protein n=1 Tax=Nitrosospira sp. Nl5 TaxID=200120 RepID=UPI000881450C|nr:hypothetical protein [Nitrosospira sp. Nl5]SCX85614.1 hypothetical protein SAMN05216420_101115 [Nitrosospira sp. Nl5]